MDYCIYQKGTGTFVVVLADAAACLTVLSQSVTSGGPKGLYLLQIETKVWDYDVLSRSVTVGREFGP